MSDEFILETDGLTKEFAGFVAVSDVNLRVRRGSIHALIGPNRVGKSTCSSSIDLEGPKAGEVLVEIMATDICHTDAYTLDDFNSEGIFPSILGG